MSKPKVTTSPNLAAESPLHQQAITAGKEHYSCWTYNVADRFKNSSPEEVKDALKRNANPFAVCFEHWIGDFNLGTGIRNANAFGVEAVYYVGEKKWDRRSAVGVYNYTPVNFLPTIKDLLDLKKKYTFVGVDNVPGSIDISTHGWQAGTLLIFGEEGTGLTPEMQEICDVIVEIPMFGSVRSLNCGTASGIVMYDFVSTLNIMKDGFL